MEKSQIIESLKRNLAEYGHLDDEFRQILLDVRRVDILMLTGGGDWIQMPSEKLNNDKIYRLHRDYQPQYIEPESEIKERKIDPLPAFNGGLGIRIGMDAVKLSDCINIPGFSGFKFDGEVSAPTPIIYKLNSGQQMNCFPAVDVKSGTCTTIHATHVIFKKNPR